MTPKDVIRGLFAMNDFVMNEYLKDMSDAELLMRPVPAAHHAAWQLGHLINSEAVLMQSVPGAQPPDLPEGWAKQYAKETAHVEPPTGFHTKAQFLEQYRKVRAHSLQCLESYPESELDKKTEGRLAAIVPNIAGVFTLVANHPMMHVGQIVVLRRKLGKPVVI